MTDLLIFRHILGMFSVCGVCVCVCVCVCVFGEGAYSRSAKNLNF